MVDVSGDDRMDEELEFDRVVASLAFAAAPAEPPASVREQLLARVAEAQAAESALPPGGFFVKPGVTGVHTEDVDWGKTFVKGLYAKTIHRDEARKTTTRLLKIEPGVRYPRHKHGGPEEIFLLSGTLWVNGIFLKAGDYCRSEAGTVESGTFSEDGATAIIVSSDGDEIDAGPAAAG
jgi:quercetin dioxygenase-like cupin family protein